ncbi:hypothetical protein G9396_02500 [Providencia rettgeri]|nr:hypothetical protein G9396_02500 [Providencia rettgeri]
MGSSSALYGQGGAGGVINMQSRRPSANESHQIQFQKGNFDNDSIKFDTTGALNDSETLLYRMDGLALSTDSQINSSKQSRYLLAPSLTWQPNEKLSLTVLSQYQRDPHISTIIHYPLKRLVYYRIETENWILHKTTATLDMSNLSELNGLSLL